MLNPLVSVVIPTHNKAQTVKRTIDSVKSQTLNNLECFIVNDSSTDGSKSVILDAIKDDKRFSYSEVSYRNVADTRNFGIQQSSGIYICTIDSDDWIDDTFLEKCTKELIKDRSLGIVYTGLRTHHADGSSTISQWPGQFNPDKQLSYPKMNQCPTCNVFRRAAWERVGGFKARYAPYSAGSEDAALWSAITSIGYNAKQVTVDYSAQIYALGTEILKIKTGSDMTDLAPKIEELRKLREQDGKAEPLFNYTAHGGHVHGNRDYSEVDWLSMYPWAKDGLHPFASVATPKRWSHPVRQYDQPLVSVVIPVGPGHELEVQNALDSLEMQSFRKWEVIVVDDTGSKGKPHSFYDLSISYPYARQMYSGINNEHSLGAGISRNRGASMARAPLLFFLDADDVLAHPDALQMMIEAWNAEQSIIYSDYLGKAVWDYDAAKKAMGDNLLDYNTKTGMAVFKKQSQDFDCELAIKQPLLQMGDAMPYYHWSLVSVLIPKMWHDKIGGFDESMETWEDVLYHWEAARLGYCYHRIPEPLVLYNYHKGHRREASQVIDESGRQKHKSLVQYIKTELEKVKIVGCNCGKRKQVQSTVTEAQMADMPDTAFVMIEFDFPGSETRQTYGKALPSPSRQIGPDKKLLDYKGYGRQKGDRFLVHIQDQRARPDMFKLVQHEVILPEVERVELPEPQLLVPEAKRRGRPAKVRA